MRQGKQNSGLRPKKSGPRRPLQRMLRAQGTKKIDVLKEKINDTDYVSVAISKIASDLAREFY